MLPRIVICSQDITLDSPNRSLAMLSTAMTRTLVTPTAVIPRTLATQTNKKPLPLPGPFTGQGRVERAAATRAAGRAAPEPLDEHAPHRGQGRLGRRAR